MAKSNVLTVKRVEAIMKAQPAKPAIYTDGGGLYLRVRSTGTGSWIWVSTKGGKRRELALGSATVVKLAAARERAGLARAALEQGRDPFIEKAPAEVIVESVAPVTFGSFAETHIDAKESGWKNPKHRQQWRNTLTTYCKPMWDKPVADIATDDILEVLEPIWTTIPETARRVRGRIEKVLDAARAKGLRSRETPNPALWTGHLVFLLPKSARLTRGHHAAMPYAELPAFFTDLGLRDATAARALQFLILTAARTNEVLGAKWAEVDAIWTVPKDRMKSGRDHRVPLSGAAIAVLEQMGSHDEKLKSASYVFPGHKEGRPLSNMSMEMLLRRMKLEKYTVHGFRSAFRDWVGEETNHEREIAEAALAHLVGDDVERAYRRGDALAKRKAMMDDWATFVTSAQQEIVLATVDSTGST